MPADWLCVDYGTSNTVAVLRHADGRQQPLLFDGSPLLSSAVFATADGRVLTGRDAERHARSEPGRFEPNPKRRIDDADVLLGDRPYPVAELIATTLRRVGAEARRALDAPVGGLTLTHPASWGGPRRSVLADAAARAGLPAPHLVAEPVAAAAFFTAVLDHRIGTGRSILVYDLGAGTFDASVVQQTPDSFRTLAYRGLDGIGGIDLDAVVVRHVGGILGPSTRRPGIGSPAPRTPRTGGSPRCCGRTRSTPARRCRGSRARPCTCRGSTATC
ncbi:Hsp70 family protein [Dactylosporangium vinaceum]|uniref:Hsp70 family protein n=1 Tax=Dactylosporangium vinaceum TaxID=53362 RepID=A0ABV5M8T1_9ACTN|nr:Hsp70 family protein [Dactylosporangium vinaceum]UAB99551.1 Hsp70 family protein [Dactylosporangium vinaceum]